jgi:hypothetical protein
MRTFPSWPSLQELPRVTVSWIHEYKEYSDRVKCHCGLLRPHGYRADELCPIHSESLRV